MIFKSERKSLNVDLGRKRGGYVVKSRVFDFLWEVRFFEDLGEAFLIGGVF